MKLLITGSREHPEPELVWAILDNIGLTQDDVVIVGDNDTSPSSIDKAARDFCNVNSIPCDVHYADWKGLGRRAGPVRNQAMVDKQPDFVIAFPYGESRGTRGCVKMAREARIKVYVVEVLDNGL